VTSTWRREYTVYKSDALAANASEEKLGDGEQPSIASGTGGFYCAWLTHRGGELMVLAPKSDSPITIAADANDPMIASSFGGHGPVIAIWESTTDGKSAIRAARLDH
jgi:hypothetical protein